ncbi:MAG: hypothetical protein Q9166_001128 [cf. Caloplaca sp. 2 TL-2023]
MTEDNEKDRKIAGYRIENAQFLKPLKIPSQPSRVETLFYLRPLADAVEKDNTSEYRLCVNEDGNWEEFCRGKIQFEYESPETQVDGGKELFKEALRQIALVDHGLKDCDLPIATEELYEMFHDAGAQYGEAFQVLSNVLCSTFSTQSAAEISLGKWTARSHTEFAQPYVFHPTTMDGLFQTIVPALSKGGRQKLPTMIPSRIGKLWVSKDLESTFITSDGSTSEAKNTERHLCSSLEWKPDLDVACCNQVTEYCEQSRPQQPSPEKFYQDLRLMIFFFITDTLTKLAELPTPEGHIARYIDWMHEQVRRYDEGNISISQAELGQMCDDGMYRDELIQRLQHRNCEGKFFAIIGANLFDMLRGSVDPLILLFEGDLAQAYYQEQNSAPQVFTPFAAYLGALTHKNPSIKILEVGAGTGGATGPVLKALVSPDADGQGSRRYSRYDFTDVSPGFLEGAEERFKDHQDTMRYMTLDIEIDPCSQGFQEEEYDLIFASNVLHATQDLNSTLLNTRKLLKPGGKLVLFEVTESHMMRTGFAFGLLAGWWQATNDDRFWRPCLTEAAWKDALCTSGFSGIDVFIPDHHAPKCHESSIMVTTAASTALLNKPLSGTSITIVTHGDNNSQLDLVILEPNPNTNYIFLLEIDNAFLSNITESEFAKLKSIIRCSKSILWVTQEQGSTVARPEIDMVTGFARAIRSEYVELKFATLALEGSSCLNTSTEMIRKALEQVIDTSVDRFEPEYRQRGGILEISRVVGENKSNRMLAAKTAQQEWKMQAFGNDVPLKLHIAAPGLLDSLEFHEDHEASQFLLDDEIEVEVKVTGVNFRDCLIALGRLSEDNVGSECAGVVRRFGNRVTDFCQGDRVAVSSMGAFKTYVRANKSCVIRIPDEMSFIQAASLPTTALTAYHALYNVARLQPGETVLVHTGAGATGQMAIQIAQHLQAKVYTTVGSTEKQRFL